MLRYDCSSTTHTRAWKGYMLEKNESNYNEELFEYPKQGIHTILWGVSRRRFVKKFGILPQKISFCTWKSVHWLIKLSLRLRFNVSVLVQRSFLKFLSCGHRGGERIVYYWENNRLIFSIRTCKSVSDILVKLFQ